jgi:hypothetical protein
MSLHSFLGLEPEVIETLEQKEIKTQNLFFDLCNSLSERKEDRFNDFEEVYDSFNVNLWLSRFTDLTPLANELNKYPDIPKEIHYWVVNNGIRKQKRYFKSGKQTVNPWIEKIQKRFQCSKDRAEEYLKFFNPEDLKKIDEWINRE